MRSFASDNNSGVHPAVLDAIAQANVDHAHAYGADPWTARAEDLVRERLGADAAVFFVTNGTAANVLALRATCRPWEAVICTTTAHMNCDECAAPEQHAGVKLHAIDAPDGKLTPPDLERVLTRLGGEHHGEARLVSISQSTELGTVYTPQELRELTDAAHALGLLVHVDGARLFYAAQALGVDLAALTSQAGIDVLSLGGTKLALLGADAVVFLRRDLADGFPYLRKQSLALQSKGRFLAAQFAALLEEDRWIGWAANANAMALRLRDLTADLPGLTITQPVQANAVFASLPHGAIAALQGDWPFHLWNPETSEVRWMCSWDTTASEVDAFASAIATALREPL